MNKKIIAAILAGAMAFNTSIIAFASPVTSEQKEQIEQKQSEYKDAEDKLNVLNQKLQELQGQAQKLDSDIASNNTEIKSKENNIKSLEDEMTTLQKDLEEKENLYGERMRAIYKSGNPGYVEIILSSTNFSDLATNVQAVGKLMGMDKEMMDEIKAKKEELNSKKTAMNAELEKVQALKAETQTKLDELNSQKSKQKELVDQAAEVSKNIKVDLASKERTMIQYPKEVIENSNSSIADLTAARKSLTEIRQQVKVIDSEVVDLIEKAKTTIASKEAAKASSVDRGGSVNNSSGGDSTNYPSGGGQVGSGSVSQLLSIAYSLQGKPYVYGATGPNTFDCSGFTQYVYGRIGVGLSRTTFTQVNEGTSIPISQAQAGDLVFFGSASSPHHVGIYVGNGQYIHAPQTGDVVKVSSLSSRSDLAAVRRIL